MDSCSFNICVGLFHQCAKSYQRGALPLRFLQRTGKGLLRSCSRNCLPFESGKDFDPDPPQ